MRHKASEDMSAEEYRHLEIDIKTTNPNNHCTCANWNNEDGICSFCDWEENYGDNGDTRDEELAERHQREDDAILVFRLEESSALLPSQHQTGVGYGC